MAKLSLRNKGKRKTFLDKQNWNAKGSSLSRNERMLISNIKTHENVEHTGRGKYIGKFRIL